MERSRRQPAQNNAAAKAKGALEQLRAARAGAGNRALNYEVKAETAVYDVVDDQQYAEIVKKRRDAGDFVVDDDGAGYADIGEDDYWNQREDEDAGEGSEEEEGAEGKQAGKKRKKEQGGGKGGAKRKAGEGGGEEGAAAAPAGGSITAMFRKAAAKGAAIPGLQRPAPGGAKPSDASSDDVLDSILGDLLPGGAGGAGGGGGGGAGMYGRPAPVPYGARPLGPGLARAAAPAGPGMYGAYGGVMPPRAGGGLAAVAALAHQRPPQQPQPAGGAATAAAAGGAAAAAAAAVTVKEEEDAAMAEAHEDAPDAEHMDAAHDDDDAAPPQQHEQQQQLGAAAGGAPAAAAAAAAAEAAAAAAAAAAAPAPRPGGRNFAEAPATPADGGEVHRAEDVWDAMYGAGEPDAADAAAASPLPAPAAADGAATPSAAAAADLPPLDAEGRLPFYFIDAYENPEAKPGEVILFGKVAAPPPEPPPPSAGRAQPPQQQQWLSCAAVVRGLQRCLLVVPTPDVFADGDGALAAAAAAAAADPARRVELLKRLQERCAGVRDEVRGLLAKAGVATTSVRMVPVRRSYAFELPHVPRGPQWVIKVRYPACMPTLPSPPGGGPPSGRTFVAIFNAHQSPLEALMLKRRIKGPGWMALAAPVRVEQGRQATWCKVEVALDGAKRVVTPERGLPPDAAARPAPPLTAASLSLKTVIHPTSHQHEVVAASVVHLGGVSPDAPAAAKDWSTPARLRSFSIVRRLDGRAWPQGMEAAAAAENATPRGRANGGSMVSLQDSERALLTCLLARLQAVDADVLVGHNLAAFDVTVLLGRMQHHKVPMWSRIGRVKKTEFPRLTGGGHTFGGGAGAGVMAAVAGRLLCDTYLSARELVKSVDFTLATLAASLLGQTRSDLAAAVGGSGANGSNAGNNGGMAACYASADGVLRLLRHGESDAWLALGLMFHLSVLPLTKQLACLSGHLWGRTLAGQRAQRIEALLLHEFHGRKFILPDRQTFKDKQRRAAAAAEADEEGGMMDGPPDDDDGAAPAAKKKGSKAAAAAKSSGPKYAGGLVLEPKKGLYDKIVIILDFNSLYPSIIQEYNICFTTVQRPADGSLPPLPDPSSAADGLAPLPAVLQALVQRRKQVKQAMAVERNPITRQQLQVRQQAIKLTANSIYGCLGFGASRFYAQPLAELTTAQGRSILSSTVELVQGALGAEVIYGDTDSIMVATRSDSVDEARQLGARIKKEVNKRYKLLEIELDGVFRSLLLLKKKKYAAIKLEPEAGGRLVEVMEQKGLDIVRRDWCPLSKDAGNFALAAVLSGRGREEVVAEIHAHLRDLATRVRGGQVPLGKYIITKQLTKRPEDYPDAKNQPHVQVALRRRAAGKRDGVLPGETVPYIICVERADPAAAPATAADGAAAGADGAAAATPGAAPAAAPAAGVAATGGLAERARHPEELRERQSLAVDVEYYLAQQVHPVVSRLVSTIEGTDAAHIADCLGLDPARFRGNGGAGNGGGLGYGAGEDDEGLHVGSSAGTLMDEDDNFRSCAPLVLRSPNGTAFPLRGVDEVLRGAVLPEHLLTPPDALGDEGAALGAAALANQVLLRAREAVARYYDGTLRADDEAVDAGGCRSGVLRPAGGGEEAGGAAPDRCAHPDPSRQGVQLRRAVTERDLYLQLCHFHRLLHVEGAVRRHWARLRAADPRSGVTVEDVRAMVPEPLARTLAAAVEALDTLRRRSAWHWVPLGQLFECLTQQPAGDGKQPGPLAAGVAAGRTALLGPAGAVASVRGVVA